MVWRVKSGVAGTGRNQRSPPMPLVKISPLTTYELFAILLARAPPGESAARQVILSVGILILGNMKHAANIDILAIAGEFREGV